MARSRNFQADRTGKLPQKGRTQDNTRRAIQAAMESMDEDMDSDWEQDRQNGLDVPDSFYDNLLRV